MFISALLLWDNTSSSSPFSGVPGAMHQQLLPGNASLTTHSVLLGYRHYGSGNGQYSQETGGDGTTTMSPDAEMLEAAAVAAGSWPCAIYDFIIETIVMGLLCLFGFIGNSLSIICLWRDGSKTATPFLLISLDVADTVFLVTVTILRVVQSAVKYVGWDDMVSMAPVVKYVYPVALIAMTSTVYLTLLVTLNRYVSVCKPHDVRTLCAPFHARLHVVAVVLFSIFYNLPRFFEFDVVDVPMVQNPAAAGVEETELEGGAPSAMSNSTILMQTLLPSDLTQNRVYQIVYVNTLYFIVMFFVPLTALVILNAQLIHELRLARRRREELLGGARRRASSLKGGIGGGASSEEDITLTLIVVVVVFVVCQTPALVTQTLISVLSPKDKTCPRAFFYYERLSDLFVVINSAVNFVIYCFCSRHFRCVLFELCGLGKDGHGRSPDVSGFSSQPLRNASLSSSPAVANQKAADDAALTNWHQPKMRIDKSSEKSIDASTNRLTTSFTTGSSPTPSTKSANNLAEQTSIIEPLLKHGGGLSIDSTDHRRLMLAKWTVDKCDTFATTNLGVTNAALGDQKVTVRLAYQSADAEDLQESVL